MEHTVVHSCYNVHLNEAGRDTKSEQFPRMGPVSMMNAVILIFGANGPVFRKKKWLLHFLVYESILVETVVKSNFLIFFTYF